MAKVLKSSHNTKHYADQTKRYAEGGLVDSLLGAGVEIRKAMQKVTDPKNAEAREKMEAEQKQREAVEAEEKRKDEEYLKKWGTPRDRTKPQYTGGR